MLRLPLAVLLVALSAVAAPAAHLAPARLVTVIATEYRFTPSRLTFERGLAYRLHLENRGTELHEFHAPEFFKAVRLADPAVLNIDRTEIVLHPGDRKDLYFVARRRGHYPLFCPDHDWAGMTGEITIK